MAWAMVTINYFNFFVIRFNSWDYFNSYKETFLAAADSIWALFGGWRINSTILESQYLSLLVFLAVALIMADSPGPFFPSFRGIDYFISY